MARTIQVESMDDRAMILAPQNWPRWPVLPVKRSVSFDLECGFIMAEHKEVDKPMTIYLSSIFSLPGEGCKTWGEVLARIPEEKRRRYDTLDAMLADGWMVD